MDVKNDILNGPIEEGGFCCKKIPDRFVDPDHPEKVYLLRKALYGLKQASRATEYQLADMFTKALPEDRFQYLVRRIGMRCLTPAELEVRDDTDDEPDDQELEAHYMYMTQIQEVTPDAADNSGPIFDVEPLQKVQNNNDNYNVFAIENEHPEQPESVNDTYLEEQGDTNITIDSLDMCYDEEQDDQDDTDELAQERDLLAFLINKLKCEIDGSKNCNKFLESSNKALVDKLKAPELTKRLSLTKKRSKLSDLIRPFDYDQLNNLYDLFVPQCEKSPEQHYLSTTLKMSHTYANKEISKESFRKQTTLLEKRIDESIPWDQECKSSKELFKIKKVLTRSLMEWNVKCDRLEKATLPKCRTMSKSFEALQKHAINLELDLQQCKEKIKNDKSLIENQSKVFLKECEQYFEIQDLKAQLQDKEIAISELQKLIEKMKGKSVETKFEKSLVIRQPNAYKSQRQSVLGKLAIFSNSLEKKDFSKSKSVTKNDVSNDFSKPVTAQIFPQNIKSVIKNTNVIAPGIVSRPQLKSNRMGDRVMPKNSKGKKQEVEDHRRNFKFSNNKTFVTACNDSLNAKTSNVKFVCVTCGKCVLNDNHDLCVLHYINGVNSRTRQPIVVPISTREPKQNVNQSVATSHKKTVATDSTVKKPRNIIRKIYEQVSKDLHGCWYPKLLTPRYKWKPKSPTGNVNTNVSIPLGIASRTANILEHMTPRNDQIAPILGYGDLVQGTITIKRVYYVEGLNHNLFSVGQFCDADLEVSFQKCTCYIRDLKGNDLLIGSRSIDLYSITLQDTTTPNPIYLMAKATSSQAWTRQHAYFLQHHPLNNVGQIDHPLEQVIGNPSQSVRTRRQLETDGKMCMFTLTVSQTEPKNIKEAMANSAWIEAMQEELHQFDLLRV
ncbi:hypothetical protein Tco_0500506 [Tanacetum coccineum]